jgi:uncharacterized protein DUF2865
MPHRHNVTNRRRSALADGLRRASRPTVVSVLAALAAMGVVTGLAATGAAHHGAGLPGASGAVPDEAANAGAVRAPERIPRLRLAQGGGNPFVDFLKGLLGMEQRPEPRRLRRLERLPPRPAPAPDASGTAPGTETYRTMCVRLCDGYYWPVSFSTTRDSFERDAHTCTQSCSGSAALYYYPNPGGAVDDMVSLDGRSYKQLGTAFLYRSTYDANCKCHPHPWEAEAAARHKSYAKPPVVRPAATGRQRGH